MDVGYSRRQRSRDMSWGCVRLGPDLDFAVERPLYGLILSQGGVQRDVNYGLNSGPCPPSASGDLSQEWRSGTSKFSTFFALAYLPLTSRSSR